MIQPLTVHHSSGPTPRCLRTNGNTLSPSLDPLTRLSITFAAVLGILFWTTLIVWLWDNSSVPMA